MKKLLLLLFPLGALAADPRGVLVSSTHVLTYPTDFFTINSNLIVAALGGVVASGDVVGPGSATSGGIALFSGTTGKLLSSSTLTEANILTESEASALYAPLASPALTGNPTVPTASPGDNDTSAASTAFVTAAIAAAPGGGLPGSGTAGARLLYDGSDALWETDNTISLVDHFLNAGSSSVFGSHSFEYSGSITFGQTAGETNAPGQIYLNTGASTSGSGAFTTYASALAFGGSAITTRFKFRTPATNSDAANTFQLRLGFQDSATGTLPTDAACFLYTTNNPNWVAYTASNSSATSADTGVVVTNNAWYIGEIVVASDATSVVYKINGVSVATNTTTVPSGTTRATGIASVIAKSNGSNLRVLILDWWKTWIKLL